MKIIKKNAQITFNSKLFILKKKIFKHLCNFIKKFYIKKWKQHKHTNLKMWTYNFIKKINKNKKGLKK